MVPFSMTLSRLFKVTSWSSYFSTWNDVATLYSLLAIAKFLFTEIWPYNYFQNGGHPLY